MVKGQRDMAVKLLSSVGVWGILGAVFLPIYKDGSELWVSGLMVVVAVVAMAAAFKLVGIEYPEASSKKSTSPGESMNPVVMAGAAAVLADEESAGSTSSGMSSDAGSGSSSE